MRKMQIAKYKLLYNILEVLQKPKAEDFCRFFSKKLRYASQTKYSTYVEVVSCIIDNSHLHHKVYGEKLKHI